MTDENKDICPETPENPDLPETPEAAPEEPKEVVSWYIPKEPQGREVVSYYVQRDPMPQNVWQQAAKKEKRRSRLWLWISLAVLAVTVAAVVLAAILGGNSGSGQHRPLPDGDGDNPSSIVDIFGSKATTIPRIQGDKGVRLACRDPQSQPLTAQEVYAKVNPSVVTVVSEQSEGASIGTGVIMTSDGYIITNAHVISGGKSCWVALDTGVTYEVNLVGFDEEEDLAVLKADPQNPLPAAEFGNSDLVQVGDTAYAIGNPLGVELRGTMTSGIISAVNRAVEVDGKTMTLLQTSAALNNGNSGGPLINEYGQVIGINTLKMSTTDSTEATVEGLGFALPISSVSFVVNDLIANGHYRGAPSLGITVTTVEKDGGGTQVQVMEVSTGSGAADAGIQAGARKVYLIEEPVAAAIGAGIDITQPDGHMVVDIGGGTADIAVISLSGVVESASIKIAGDQLNEAVVKYMRRKHNLLVGERTAEEMKKQIGCVFPKDEEETMDVKGRCLLTGLPKVVTVSSTEMMDAFEEPVERIMEAIHSVLERTPPELVADVSTNGIIMTGGGSLVYGFDKLVTARTGIHTTVADDAISCVVLGTGKSLDSLNAMQDGTMNLSRRKQMN